MSQSQHLLTDHYIYTIHDHLPNSFEAT